jgi:hypothetical protein
LTGISLVPSAARAVSLIVDRLDTPDIVQAGDRISFSFAFQFDAGEILIATQAEISAPHLTDFRFASNSGITGDNPWDLSSTFRRRGSAPELRDLNPMWVHVENQFGDDPVGVTWDEVDGVAPLGKFSAIATYNGEIEFSLSTWELAVFGGFDEHGFARLVSVAMDPAYEHIRTGVTVVGGLDLPPPPVVTDPPAPPPQSDVPQDPVPATPVGANPPPDQDPASVVLPPFADRLDGIPRRDQATDGIYYPTSTEAVPEPPLAVLAWLSVLLLAARRRAWWRAPPAA